MSAYIIYFGTNPVATIKDIKYAYKVSKYLAESLSREVSLVKDTTGEEVACFNSNGELLED